MKRGKQERMMEYKWKSEMFRTMLRITKLPDRIKTDVTMDPSTLAILQSLGVSPGGLPMNGGARSRAFVKKDNGNHGIFSDFEMGNRIEKLHIDPNKLKKQIQLKNLYFDDADIICSRIVHALGKGKNLIFYGPPGTGKSTLAKEICNVYNANYFMTTATSDWTTFETIGGYMLEEEGNLRFHDGIFLRCFQKDTVPINQWLIIDEINRADIDKAFGPMFSAFIGDNIILPQKKDGEYIEIKGKPEMNDEVQSHKYYIHPNWRLIGTLNTFDKSSLYEMSFAFMRRFSFIPINNPKNLDKAVDELNMVWNMDLDPDTKKKIATMWKLVNRYREIGPAIIEDVARYLIDSDDFTSTIIMNILPQFEGLDDEVLIDIYRNLIKNFPTDIDGLLLKYEMKQFFDIEQTGDWT